MIQFNFKCLRDLTDFIKAFDGILLSSFVGIDNDVSHVDHNIRTTLEEHLKEVEKELISLKSRPLERMTVIQLKLCSKLSALSAFKIRLSL